MSLASGLIFSPQTIAPSRSYLSNVRAVLLQEKALRPLLDAILGLPNTWKLLTESIQGVNELHGAEEYTRNFVDWIVSGESSVLETAMSGIVTLPLLTIIHLVQYFHLLKLIGVRHAEFLASAQSGGAHGYCVGLLASITVAASLDEAELAENASNAVRIALAIGAAGEIGVPQIPSGSMTMTIRLKWDFQGRKIISEFPDTRISATSGPKTISISGPVAQMKDLRIYAEQQGLLPRMMHIRSNLHNSENAAVVQQLLLCCSQYPHLRLPDVNRLQVPVRSNKDGNVLADCDLTAEVVNSLLVLPCDWHEVLAQLSNDLERTGHRSHTIAILGLCDPVSPFPFERNLLKITKLDVHSLVRKHADLGNRPSPPASNVSPTDAIAVVGAACRLPGANNLDELWDILSNGESKVEKIKRERIPLNRSFRAQKDKEWFNARDFYGNFVENVDEFDNSFFGVSMKEALHMDPQQRLLLTVAFEALDSSGYIRRHQRETGEPIGCFIGASYTEYLENTSSHLPSALTATGTIRTFLSGKISHYFGWTGPSEVVDTACSASLVAIHRACQAIKAGECPWALAGGVNILTGVQNFFDLGKAGFLSSSGQCKPFEQAADGYCRSDGVGLIALKPLDHAIADGNHIFGVIRATSTNNGGLSPAITVPHSAAQVALYQTLLRKANIHPDQVSYFEAHGSGTQAGDPVEMASIREVFGHPDRNSPLDIGSLKANIGHCETTAGVAGLMKLLAMFAHQGIPPQAGFQQLNPKIPPLEPSNLRIRKDLVSWDAQGERIACLSSYGASGSNAALLCSEWLAGQNECDNLRESSKTQDVPILLTAPSRDGLQLYVKDVQQFIRKSAGTLGINHLAFTLSERRQRHRFGWTATAPDIYSLTREMDLNHDSIYETRKDRGSVVLMISGQVQTHVNLDPRLCELYPRLREYLNTCRELLQGMGYPDIERAIFQAEPLENVVLLQCAMFTVQYACARCWIDSGAEISAVIGHSFGELTALAVTGVLPLVDALQLVAKRASLIATKWGQEPGKMLVVHGSLKAVMAVINSVDSSPGDYRLEIACYNSPTSHVLTGTSASIAKAELMIKTDFSHCGLQCQHVGASHGFHSWLTEPFLSELLGFAQGLTFNKPAIPLETCTAEPVHSITPEYIVNHTRKPVYFADAVRRGEERFGRCVWLEAGWRTRIVSMTKRAFAKPDKHLLLPFDSVSSVVKATTRLWQESFSISYWGFLTPTENGLRHIWLPPCRLQPSCHWIDLVDRAAGSDGLKRFDTAQHHLGKILSYVGVRGDEERSHEFKIHTDAERYTGIVKAHSVRRRPLCPASLYMEAAGMGALVVGASFDEKNIHFRNLSFRFGLGCDPSRDVRLLLEDCSARSSWHFAVQSSSAVGFRRHSLSHAEGSFVLTADPDYQLYKHFVSERIRALDSDPSTERLKKHRAYSLFANVVEYSSILQGISSITLAGHEAVAHINVPSQGVEYSIHPAASRLDTISLDTFIQVVGLLINTSGDSASGYLWIATAIEEMSILPGCLRDSDSFTVYAVLTSVTSTVATGNIFVFSQDGNLRATAFGILFSKIEGWKLEKALSIPETDTTRFNSVTIRQYEHSEQVAAQVKTEGHLAERKPAGTNPCAGLDEMTKLITAYTGLSDTEISPDESLSSLGLDSLSAAELADELKTGFGIRISDVDLLTTCVRSLSSYAPTGKSNVFDATASTDNDVSGQSAWTPSGTTSEDNRANETKSPLIPFVEGHPSGRQVTKPPTKLDARHRVETAVYKEVDGIQIMADLFISFNPPRSAMPIALMIHGGGHMTLSRKAVRPAQTSFLLSHGIFPIAIDYRLCPEVNIIDGAMADVRDAYAWAVSHLPRMLSSRGVCVDPHRVAVIGWSTGGHLAMTTAWTTSSIIDLPPPSAVLSFYSPTNYDPSDYLQRAGNKYPPRTMSFVDICSMLPSRPITGHAYSTSDSSRLGWIRPGDPRSELVLSLIKEQNGLTLLLGGLPADGDQLQRPDPEKVVEISPLAQVRAARYKVPTFMVIGDEDEIVPPHTAVTFACALNERGVKNGLLVVPGAGHVHDLDLAPGSAEWEKQIEPGYRFLFDSLGIRI